MDVRVQVIDGTLVLAQNRIRTGPAVIACNELGIKVDCMIVVLDGEPCVTVFVGERSVELLRRLPTELEGYTVAVQETGSFRKLDLG